MAAKPLVPACTAWLETASVNDLRIYVATGNRPGGTVDLRPAEVRRAEARAVAARTTRTNGGRRD